MALLEWLERGHEVMSTGDTVCDDAFCDAGGDGTLDNGSDRIHGTDDLGLELRWDVELDLLEEVFGCTETTDNKNVLHLSVLRCASNIRMGLPEVPCFAPEWQ
jgi:hypothetical protein